MAAPTNGGFRVHVSKVVFRELRRLHDQAVASGRLDEFISSWLKIRRAIERNPHATGDTLYFLPNLRLQVRVVLVAPLVIHFAVALESPDVYIKKGALLT